VRVAFKLAPATALALAERAAQDGRSEKQVIVRGLEALGLKVDPTDRHERPERRQASAK